MRSSCSGNDTREETASNFGVVVIEPSILVARRSVSGGPGIPAFAR